MTLGIFMPKPNTGNSCSNVVMPPMIMAAWVSMIFSSADRPQVPAISMGGVMLPISMASTCCIAWGNAAPQEGLPSNFSNSALFWVRLLMN